MSDDEIGPLYSKMPPQYKHLCNLLPAEHRDDGEWSETLDTILEVYRYCRDACDNERSILAELSSLREFVNPMCGELYHHAPMCLLLPYYYVHIFELEDAAGETASQSTESKEVNPFSGGIEETLSDTSESDPLLNLSIENHSDMPQLDANGVKGVEAEYLEMGKRLLIACKGYVKSVDQLLDQKAAGLMSRVLLARVLSWRFRICDLCLRLNVSEYLLQSQGRSPRPHAG